MRQFYYTFDENNISLKHYIYDIGSYHYNWHEELELLIVINGEVEVCTEGTSKILNSDDVILINSNKGHATLGKKPNSIAMVLHINPKFFNNYLGKELYLYFDCCSNSDTRYDKQFRLIRGYLSEMILSNRDSSFENKLLFKSTYYGLLHTIVSYYPPKECGSGELLSSKNEIDSVRKMVEYINKNYMKKITLNDLVEISQYNRNYISKLFKIHVGINFYDYLTRIRLREATFQLGQTYRNISDIALSNGFSDVKAFNKAFKSSFEKTPTEYRMLLNENITKIDTNFKKEFIPYSHEGVNKKLLQYIADKNI